MKLRISDKTYSKYLISNKFLWKHFKPTYSIPQSGAYLGRLFGIKLYLK